MTRREFLRALAASAGGLWLAACAAAEEAVSPAQPEPGSQPADAALPEEAVQQEPEALSEPGEPSAGTPHLAVARGPEAVALVERAILALGGMSLFVPKGAWVIVKPNICVAYHSYEYAATTNPWVVGAVVRLAIEAGAKKVQVMDNPFGGTPDQAYTRSGIREQVEAAGGEMVGMAPFKFVKTDIPEGQDIQSWNIYDDVLAADVLIDVPIAKHHSLARLTLGMKNLMGTISNRGGLHRNLGQRLADLTSRVRPALTVVDAVRILTANGPTGGSLDDVKQLNAVIASPDIVAADSYAATLFGLQPEEIAYIKQGTAMGLGRSDLNNLVIEEIAV